MRERGHERIEAAIDHVAAALLAGAVAYALVALAGGSVAGVQTSVAAALSAAIVYLCAIRVLRAVPAEPSGFAVRAFAPAELEFELYEELLLTEQVELVLTDADRLHGHDELVLDDILSRLGPDSRVVRLFDPGALPTAGQLNARIARHMKEATPGAASAASAVPDASRALYQALAELRRSLR